MAKARFGLLATNDPIDGMSHELQQSRPIEFDVHEAAPDRQRPSIAEMQTSFCERVRRWSGPLNGALLTLLGVTNVSGISQTDVEEARERSRYSIPEERDRIRAERIRENLGLTVEHELAATAPKHWNELYAHRRQDIEHRELRRGYVSGFEAVGLSNEGIEAVLNQLLPREWLSGENLTSISLSDAQPDTMEHYHMAGHAAAHFVPARDEHGTSWAGKGRIEIFRSFIASLSSLPQEIRAQEIIYVLVHEIAHANSPKYSGTMDHAQRVEVEDWLGVRVRHMGESGYRLHGRAISHDINQLRNATRRWLGERYADPRPGEGSLPITYPLNIHANDPVLERSERRTEYIAEIVAMVSTANIPDAAYATEEAWEVGVAQTMHYQRRISPSSERGASEFADALEHVRLVRRLIPDIRQRQEAYHRLMQGRQLGQVLARR